MDWVRALAVDQLDFYWNVHFWPRIEGLTDDEYFWEPVDGTWSGGEIGVLRDLYRATGARSRGDRLVVSPG